MSDKNYQVNETNEKPHAGQGGHDTVLKEGPTYSPENLKVLQQNDAAHEHNLHPLSISQGQATFSPEGPYSRAVKPYYAQEKSMPESIFSDKRQYQANPLAMTIGAIIGGGACSEVPILIPVGAAVGAAAGYAFDQGIQRLIAYNVEHAPKPHIELPKSVYMPNPPANWHVEHRHHEHKRPNY